MKCYCTSLITVELILARYAINFTARYMFNSRPLHEKSLKHMGSYLKVNRDRNSIMRPNDEFKIEAYPDADFAGLYRCKKSKDPRFLINVSDYPVVWISKRQ